MSKHVAQPTGLQLSNLAQSRTAEASRHKPGESISIELNGDHGARLELSAVMPAAPFEALVTATDGQAVPSDADRILPSAAAFHDAIVDPLHHGLVPLALLGQEGKSGNLAVGADRAVHQLAAVGSAPGGIVIPAPGGQSTTVFESGLGPRPGEPPGTHAGQPAFPTTTKTGTISFSSPDGVQSVSLGGHLLSNSPQTFTDPTGSLTASFTFNAFTGKGTITYSYTLRDNTSGDPLVNNGDTSVSFAVVVADPQGDTNPSANLVIRVKDDSSVARADTDALTPGQSTAEGNGLTGAGTTSGVADMQGADGGMTVVGVAAGPGPGGAAPGTVGVEIVGAHGRLTVFANGSYSYVHTSGGGNDVYTYTIRDADGSLSHATLTINLGDATPGNIVIPTPGGQVFEAGLPARGSEPAGSDPTKPTTTQTGTITFTSPDGVSKIELGGLVLTAANPSGSFTDATGTLTASFTYVAATGSGTISYSYTLLDNTLGIPSVSFPVAVTDADGDRTVAGSNLVFSIDDDAPTAVADTDSVAAGQTTAETGNVLTGSGTADVQGADGATVATIAFGGTVVTVDPTAGATIAGTFGTLTIHAGGSYSYAHNGAPGGGTDVFTYRIKDGDGDLSSATLTIAVADSSPGGISIPGAGGADTQVFEAGLPARGTEPAGSDPTKPTTTSGTITFTSAEGVQTVELGGFVLPSFPIGQPTTITDATGSLTASFLYDPATGQGTINYSYTLLGNTHSAFMNSVSFEVAVTDLDGDRRTGGNLTINIADDSPIARSDNDRVGAAQNTPAGGNVITGVGTTSGVADALGADGGDFPGVRVVGVAPGGGFVAEDPFTVGVPIMGEFGLGRLTVFADGSYSFNPSGLPTGGFSVFTYLIKDSDGSLSTATISFNRDDVGGLSATRSDTSADNNAGDALVAVSGVDPLAQGAPANQFLFNTPSEGGAHILDFRHGTDSIDVLLSGFTGLSGTGAVAATDFVTSDNASTADLGAAHFAYNASNWELYYDSNGGDASGAS